MTARGTHRRNRNPRRLIFHASLITAGFVLAASGAAWGYFSATSDGQAAVAAGSIAPPETFTATPTSPTQVTLKWTPPPPASPPGYTYVLAGPLGSGDSCRASMTQNINRCSVKGLSPGTTYSWTLSVRFHTWFSAKVPATATTWHFAGVGAMTTWAQHTSPTTKQVVYPSTAAETDLLVMIVARSHNYSVTCPSGWTRQTATKAVGNATHGFLEVCWTIDRGGTHVTMTISGTGNTGSEAEIAAFANMTTTTPFDTTTTTQKILATSLKITSGTYTPPSFTPYSRGDTALSVVMENDTTTTPNLELKTTLGVTQGFMAPAPSGGQQNTKNSSALDFAYKSVQTAGAVQFPTWNGTSQTGDVWIGLSLALKS